MKQRNYYDSKKIAERATFFSCFNINDGVTEEFIKIISDHIHYKKEFKLLDLGTGDGFLIQEILKRNSSKLDMQKTKLVGIDLSSDMIAVAQKKFNTNKNMHFYIMDNNNIKYPDNYFDIVTAKSVSSFSASEVNRVLKPGGLFFYKEYNHGKGLVEIMDLLIKKSKSISSIGAEKINEMKSIGFNKLELREYYIPLLRKRENVEAIIKTMRVLPFDVNQSDALIAIKRSYGRSTEKIIHSDPFIVIGEKNEK